MPDRDLSSAVAQGLITCEMVAQVEGALQRHLEARAPLSSVFETVTCPLEEYLQLERTQTQWIAASMAGQVALTCERYHDLLRKEQKLEALEAGGVDNWERYADSLEPYRKWLKEHPDVDR